MEPINPIQPENLLNLLYNNCVCKIAEYIFIPRRANNTREGSLATIGAHLKYAGVHLFSHGILSPAQQCTELVGRVRRISEDIAGAALTVATAAPAASCAVAARAAVSVVQYIVSSTVAASSKFIVDLNE